MEKTIGPDHITTLRLIYHWGRMIARGSVSRIHDSARAKELYQRALAGFSKHLGSHDPETIDCTHDLGTLYLTQAEPNYTLAEALFLCLYTSQREELGMDDDRTLRSLAALARTYRLQGKNAQAGKLIWIGPEYGLRVLEDFFFELNGLGSMKYWKFPRGKRDYMNEIWELSSFGAPDDYCWQNKALLCLPIQQVHFTTALPSDLEKFNYWHHIGHMESNHEPSGLHHMCEIVEDTHIDLVVPYIPYSHFLQSNDFTSGFLYKSYVLPWIGLGWLDFGETCVSDKLTERKNTSSKYVMVNSESSSTCITGFFNGIPGDTAIISNYDNDTHTSFNFVSSNWVDYKQFTLHTTTEEMTPKLTTADGSTITCHGYISGTWTDFNAKSTWNGLMVFVVDAVFYFPESSTVDHHFLFCSDSLEPDRQYFMTPEETRSFCASLNPTLLSPLKISRVEWCGIFHKECRVNVKGPSQVDMLFWEEMSQQEAWDREFENNIPELPEDKSRMEQLKEEETHLRQEWDLKFRQPPTMQQNVTSSVANGAAQSHKPLSRAAILGKLRR
ncbi:hypothetical protein L208DRAFT_606221 [Tricholoma matsutake]|nr:hypothetical protein L208DRAFT_606221 [Tricholoma matsutake 945]